VRLHHYGRSSCSYRVRIALELKGVDWESVPVDLRSPGGGEQHSDAYRDVNRMRQVPTLEWEVGGAVRRLGQSLAIVDYLDRRFPAPPLLPEDPYLRAKAWQLAEIVNAGIQPLQNLGVMRRVARMSSKEEARQWSSDWIARGLAALEAEAAETAGRFCVGDEVTVADLCLVPQMVNARRLGLDVEPYPTLGRVESACMELRAFRDEHPERGGT